MARLNLKMRKEKLKWGEMGKYADVDWEKSAFCIKRYLPPFPPEPDVLGDPYHLATK